MVVTAAIHRAYFCIGSQRVAVSPTSISISIVQEKSDEISDKFHLASKKGQANGTGQRAQISNRTCKAQPAMARAYWVLHGEKFQGVRERAAGIQMRPTNEWVKNWCQRNHASAPIKAIGASTSGDIPAIAP